MIHGAQNFILIFLIELFQLNEVQYTLSILVERLLNEGANPNSHNEDGLTPLHQCAIDDNQVLTRIIRKTELENKQIKKD